MQRLLKDAQKITGIKYNINNLSDVYEAIHVIQKEIGITGTTALEAEKTLTGSIASLKSSWENFLSGSGDLGQVVDSAEIAFENIVRIVGDAVPSIINNLIKSMPRLFKLGEKILQSLINGIKSNLYNTSEGRGMISIAIDVITSFTTKVLEMIPEIINLGIEVLAGLIEGMAESLPEMIEVAINAILSLVEGLLDNIDMLVDAGIALILGLADGLIEALPILIEKAPVIIVKLVDAILRNLPKLLEAGVKLIFKLAEGLIKAVPQLLSKIPQIVSGIVKSFGNYVSSFWEIGKNIVKGIWNGIRNVKDWLFEKIKGFKDAVLNKFKSFFGIHSPSTLFRDEIGEYLALGIGEGFNDSIGAVYKKMRSTVDFETQKLSANLSTTANVNKMLTAYIEVNGDVNMDGDKVGRMVAPAVARNFRTAGAY